MLVGYGIAIDPLYLERTRRRGSLGHLHPIPISTSITSIPYPFRCRQRANGRQGTDPSAARDDVAVVEVTAEGLLPYQYRATTIGQKGG